MPSLMMMTLIVSEESLARDRHTEAVGSIVNFSEMLGTLKIKMEHEKQQWSTVGFK